MRHTKENYDVVVIGGGIYGACTAWEAARHGLSVLLLEKEDFGGATSANTLRNVHGSLRYIQQLDLTRMRYTLYSRKLFMTIAPHLVHPLPVLLCLNSPKSFLMRLAMFLSDLVGYDRNTLNDPYKYIPKGRIFSREKSISLVPSLKETSLQKTALWYDAQMYNSERLTLSFILSAKQHGADTLNYATVTNVSGNTVSVKDSVTKKEFSVNAHYIVNCTGPHLSELSGVSLKHCKAINLLINKKLSSTHALGIKGKTFGTLFFVPWRDKTIVGVGFYQSNNNNLDISDNELQTFIDDINVAYPFNLSKKDVLHIYKGLLPQKDDTLGFLKRYEIIQEENVFSIMGVKYTEAPHVASQVIKRIATLLGKEHSLLPEKLVGGDIESFEEFLHEAQQKHSLDADIVTHLVHTYGSTYEHVLLLAEKNKMLLQRVTKKLPVIKAEVVNAVRNEMAITLSDVILRRTDLSSLGFPGKQCLTTCAKLMAKELKWSSSRTKKEVNSLLSFYKKNL